MTGFESLLKVTNFAV